MEAREPQLVRTVTHGAMEGGEGHGNKNFLNVHLIHFRLLNHGSVLHIQRKKVKFRRIHTNPTIKNRKK